MDGESLDLAQRLDPENPIASGNGESKPKKRGRPKRKPIEASPAEVAAAADSWGALFALINTVAGLDVPDEANAALGSALYRAVTLTWPDTSPVAMAWLQFAGCAGMVYGPAIKEKLLPAPIEPEQVE